MNELNILQNESKIQNGTQQMGGYYYYSVLIRFKYLILSIVLVSTVTAIIISLTMDNWYSATLNAVPPQNTSSMLEGAMGSINNALKNIGLSKVGGSSDGYSYIVFLSSRTVKDSIIKKYNLAKEYDMKDAKMDDIRGEFENNIEITLEPEGNYTITIWDKNPKKAAEMTNDYVNYANQLSQNLYHAEISSQRIYLEDKLAGVEKNLSEIASMLSKYSSDKMIFSPDAQVEAFSSSLSELKAELMKQEIAYNMIKTRFGENDPYSITQRELIADLKRRINDAEMKPGFAGNFSLKDAAGIGIEYMKLYTEFETFSKVKAFLMPLLEESKLNEFRQTKNLYIVDKALPAEKKSKPKRSVIVLGAFAGSFFLSIVFIILYNGYVSFKSNYEKYRTIVSNNPDKY